MAVEGNQQSAYVINFACYLAKLTGSRLTGVFLEGDPDRRQDFPIPDV